MDDADAAHAVLAERIAARQRDRAAVRPGLAERLAARARRQAEREATEQRRAAALARIELRDHQRAEDEATLAEHPRPRTRADCEGGERPCPWAGCRFHVYLDVSEDTGHISIRHEGEPWDLRETCALDLADRGGMTLEEVGEALGVTRERVRQLVERGLRLLRHARRRLV